MSPSNEIPQRLRSSPRQSEIVEDGYKDIIFAMQGVSIVSDSASIRGANDEDNNSYATTLPAADTHVVSDESEDARSTSDHSIHSEYLETVGTPDSLSKRLDDIRLRLGRLRCTAQESNVSEPSALDIMVPSNGMIHLAQEAHDKIVGKHKSIRAAALHITTTDGVLSRGDKAWITKLVSQMCRRQSMQRIVKNACGPYFASNTGSSLASLFEQYNPDYTIVLTALWNIENEKGSFSSYKSILEHIGMSEAYDRLQEPATHANLLETTCYRKLLPNNSTPQLTDGILSVLAFLSHLHHALPTTLNKFERRKSRIEEIIARGEMLRVIRDTAGPGALLLLSAGSWKQLMSWSVPYIARDAMKGVLVLSEVEEALTLLSDLTV